MRDTVNFLDYIGDPIQLERRAAGHLGDRCSCCCSRLLAYLLKKEYWKDVIAEPRTGASAGWQQQADDVHAETSGVMTLYSRGDDPACHCVRIESTRETSILAGRPEDLIDLNPYQSVPTLVDRELVVYESRIIVEYLEERFLPQSAVAARGRRGRGRREEGEGGGEGAQDTQGKRHFQR